MNGSGFLTLAVVLLVCVLWWNPGFSGEDTPGPTP